MVFMLKIFIQINNRYFISIKKSHFLVCFKISFTVKNANLTRSANSKFAKFYESANSRNANPRLLNLEIISIHLDHLYK